MIGSWHSLKLIIKPHISTILIKLIRLRLIELYVTLRNLKSIIISILLMNIIFIASNNHIYYSINTSLYHLLKVNITIIFNLNLLIFFIASRLQIFLILWFYNDWYYAIIILPLLILCFFVCSSFHLPNLGKITSFISYLLCLLLFIVIFSFNFYSSLLYFIIFSNTFCI